MKLLRLALAALLALTMATGCNERRTVYCKDGSTVTGPGASCADHGGTR